jgi:hypothetical protein
MFIAPQGPQGIAGDEIAAFARLEAEESGLPAAEAHGYAAALRLAETVRRLGIVAAVPLGASAHPAAGRIGLHARSAAECLNRVRQLFKVKTASNAALEAYALGRAGEALALRGMKASIGG